MNASRPIITCYALLQEKFGLNEKITWSAQNLVCLLRKYATKRDLLMVFRLEYCRLWAIGEQEENEEAEGRRSVAPQIVEESRYLIRWHRCRCARRKTTWDEIISSSL